MNRYWVMLRLLMVGSYTKKAEYLRKNNILGSIGKQCCWTPIKIPTESYLLYLHNNVRIAADVTFITHDVIDGMFNNIEPNITSGQKLPFYMGSIEVFDNVMIGANSIILYNTKIGPNAIVAAGSVVTKDVPEGSIVGGNPAKIIGNFYDLLEKRKLITKDMPSNHERAKIIQEYFHKANHTAE